MRRRERKSETFPRLLQAEDEKTELGERRREAEAERAAAREEVARVQQEMMDLLSEKRALENSHSHWQDLCQRLEAELSLLQKENAQALLQHSQVRDPGPFTHFLCPDPPAGRTRMMLLLSSSLSLLSH